MKTDKERNANELSKMKERLRQWQEVLNTGLPRWLVPMAQPSISFLENKIKELTK